jgi:hypothetical protein
LERDMMRQYDDDDMEMGDGIAPPMTSATIEMGISNDDYHADHSAYSNSMLKAFRDRRRKFEAKYVTKTAPIEERSEERSEALEIGDMAHAAILEPERLQRDFVMIPNRFLAVNRAASTKEAKAFIAEANAAGKTALKVEKFALVEAMVESAKRRIGKWLNLPSKRECVIRWQHPATGLPLKCRADWLIETPDTVFLIDAKTTRDASPNAFQFACEDYCYWMQQIHYCEGVRAWSGKRVEMHFLAIEKEFPFASSICQISETSIRQGEAAREKLLGQLAECLQSGNFAEPWEEEINQLTLRPWKIDPSAT